MMTSEFELLKILADGKLHSGQELADMAGVSRTAVWKQLRKIRDKDVGIRSIPGRGYQLEGPLELLDEDKINHGLSSLARSQLKSLGLVYETGSTNQVLMARLVQQPVHGHVVLAEHQTAGRGRGNNVWLSAPGAGLCISFGWHFNHMPKGFSAISLAIGVVLAKGLNAGIQLKWPNDLIFDGAKLGGILVESRGQHAGTIDVVIGIGINIRLPDRISGKITQRTTDLATVTGGMPSRNGTAGIIINAVLELLSVYPEQGFEHFIEDWRALDVSRGKQATLIQGDSRIEGTVVDIDENGNLIMSAGGRQFRYGSGELSLRLNK